MRQIELPLSPKHASLPPCGTTSDNVDLAFYPKRAPQGALFLSPYSASRTRKKEAKRGKPDGVRSRKR